MYNPYTGQQYVQTYGVPARVNTMVYPLGQSGQPLSSGHRYTAVQGYAVPAHPMVQFSTPTISGVTAGSSSTIQPPYPAGNIFNSKGIDNSTLRS